jgi:broad specificity phosphatase PhoE
MSTMTYASGHCRIFLLRHGQSVANVQRVIASSLGAASESYGLTPDGRAQVRRSVGAARATGLLPETIHLLSSPLLRARESAAIAAELSGVTVCIDARLVERAFGAFELTSDENYEQVWSADREDPNHVKWGVESAESILRRGTELLHDLQRSDPIGTFVLCTHGDVASVLLCAARGVALSQHREVGAMANGELRALSLAPSLRAAPPRIA